jgi:hypothetical protein
MVMGIWPVKEGRRMARPGRSRRRIVPSRLPRWLTAFGIVLLGELAGAALLAGCAHGPARTSPASHGGTPAIPLPAGGTRAVVLRVDGTYRPIPGIRGCEAPAVPPRRCEVKYTTPAGGKTTYVGSLPFVTTIRVKAGASVTLSEFVLADPLTCSITAGGAVLSRFTSHGGPDPSCRSTIPSGVTSSTVTRTVVLRADGVPVPGIPCTPYCFPEVDYTTPTGSAGDVGAGPPPPGAGLFPYTKTVRVRPGGIVTLTASYAGDQSITCSITVGGRIVSRTTSSSGPSTVEATCRAAIP